MRLKIAIVFTEARLEGEIKRSRRGIVTKARLEVSWDLSEGVRFKVPRGTAMSMERGRR